MTCPDCAAAQVDPWHCLYVSHCEGCHIRMVSHAPGPLRSAAYAAIPASERPAFLEAVSAEYKRREAWAALQASAGMGA